MKYCLPLLFFLFSCTGPYEHGYDESLNNFDQTGWACERGNWNIWLYYEAFNVDYVNVILYAENDEEMWSKPLREVDLNYYQNKFFDITRECKPYDVKYTLYFTDKEPEAVWMYWDETAY